MLVESKLRLVGALWLPTFGCLCGAGLGCEDPGGPSGDAGVDVVGDVDVDVGDEDTGLDAPDDVPDSETEGGGDVLQDVVLDSDDADGEAPDVELPDTGGDTDSDGSVDGAPDGPTGPNVCGDGWRDPLTEECDDGLVPGDPGCTSSCTVIDRLASNDPVARERRLGVGRHPVAGGIEGHAAVMVELLGESGDEAQVVIQTFSPVGVRLGTNAWSGVPLDADPVVAALPSGEFAVAYADFAADDDGLGIRLVRVSNDASSAVIGDHANSTTDFSQRAPDIVWTGTELVVGWEDESTIPRRICTRKFNELLSPIGGHSCTTDLLPVSRVSLAVLQGQVIKAWRADDDLTSTFRVRMPGGIWDSESVPSLVFDETIALAELDTATMLAVYSDGLGVMRAAMIDASGTDLGGAVVLNLGSVPRFRPALSATADGVYLVWREPAIPPDQGEPWDPAFDELWLQRLSWDGAVLDASAEPIALPRVPWHQQGDQARPALAAVPYWPSGAVLAGWDDLTSTSYGSQAEHGDVVLELIPTPILRTPLAM